MNISDKYFYSLLRYCDVRREESLIIGVLAIFPEAKNVQFLSPKHLDRLIAAFPDCPVQTIQGYFKGFDLRANLVGLRSQDFPSSESAAAEFIATHFLTEDSSALQFSEPRIATSPNLSQNATIDRISQKLYNRYLQIYERTPSPS